MSMPAIFFTADAATAKAFSPQSQTSSLRRRGLEQRRYVEDVHSLGDSGR